MATTHTKGRLTLSERIRFHSRIDVAGCWVWQGRIGERTHSAHRASYIAFHGEIPGDMTVDHICFNTTCVNPDHLRLLPRSENAARQRKALSNYCQRGHEFTEENTGWQRDRRKPERGPHRLCLECDRLRNKGRREARAAT